MRTAFAILTMTILSHSLFPSLAHAEVIYGKDNRLDVYESKNTLHRELSKSTAGMIHWGQLRSNSNSIYSIINSKSLEEKLNVCSSERFSNQPANVACSGFLVAPDILITAGHCLKATGVPDKTCEDFAWIFDYDLKSETHNPLINISKDNIYECKEVLSTVLTPQLDYAIIKLHKKVVGRKPFKFRKTGKISDTASVVVIGHPSGLPTKISNSAKVLKNTHLTMFTTNLDTFQGNSGSAVFDATSGVVEGILVQGKTDYVLSDPNNRRSCLQVATCDNEAGNCTGGIESGLIQWGEVAVRITEISSEIEEAISSSQD